MGRGLGPLQRRILAELEGSPEPWLSTRELAESLGYKQGRISQAINGLQRRGHVLTERDLISHNGDRPIYGWRVYRGMPPD